MIKVRSYESGSLRGLEEKINDDLQNDFLDIFDVKDIKYQVVKEDGRTNYTALLLYDDCDE